MSGGSKSRLTMGYQRGEPPTSDFPPRLVSVIIPARNEAASLSHLIPKIKESLSSYPHEIIVVDDGSQDSTREIAQSNAAVVISHEKSLGKGAAMKTGAENARGDILVFLDGDGAHDPRDIPSIIAPIVQRKVDFVIGSRALPESKIPTSPLWRRLSNDLASFVISVIISFLLPLAIMSRRPSKWVRITDCTSGFRAIKKENWQKLALVSQGFEIETEMICEAVMNKLSIVEVPISCNWNSETSRLSIVQDGLKTLELLARKLVKRYWRKISASKV